MLTMIVTVISVGKYDYHDCIVVIIIMPMQPLGVSTDQGMSLGGHASMSEGSVSVSFCRTI